MSEQKKLYQLIYFVPYGDFGREIRTLRSFTRLDSLEEHIAEAKRKGWTIECVKEYDLAREWKP